MAKLIAWTIYISYKVCQGTHLFSSLFIRINFIPAGIKDKQHVLDPFRLASVWSANASGSAWLWPVQLLSTLTWCFEEESLGPAKKISLIIAALYSWEAHRFKASTVCSHGVVSSEDAFKSFPFQSPLPTQYLKTAMVLDLYLQFSPEIKVKNER